ncbi:MAG TPA: M4 family metallopeptidase, partial [Nocardioides sp.]|nr:M4 family metallopeptidase [Nocardioides sp.]
SDRTAPTQGGRVAKPAPPGGLAAAAASADRLVRSKPEVLKASRHDSFKAGKVVSSLGLHYVPYERAYRGIPVVGGDFVVATDANGKILATSVAQTRQVKLRSTRATVSKARARAVSTHRVHQAKVGRTRLVVLQQKSSKLAWETWVTGRKHGEPSRLTVYVDAHTGRILTTKEHVLEGTGNGNWEGTVTIPTSGSGSSFSMTNSNASTLKCQNATGNATFTGTDNVWGNGVATDRETGCVDAFYSAEEERQMLSTWLGRNGMNGSGGWVPIRVGLNDVNAFYDGTQVQVGHTQTGGKWIGSIDVVAHEFGHGVDDHTPGGISGNGTQEFVADTFGASTEWFANNPADVPDFTVGEEVNLVGQGPIRVMYNPSAVGDSNCYSSSIPNQEVHAAAGPGNHWYYLMAEGSSPTNGQPNSPTCNGSSVTGIGVQKAQQIMYSAMLLKTTSSSYLKYRTWTLTAAKNLFPGSCTEFNTVKAAWDAVSVPAQAADPTCSATGGVTVTNPGNKTGTVGTAISSFTLSASGGTAPYTWTATGLPPGISVSSSGTVSGTPTTAGTYNPTVTAHDSASGTGSATFTFTISGGGGGGCSSPGQKLGNPGFETGSAAPWSASAGVIDSSASQAAHAGAWKAWLDGYGTTHTDTLSQSVTIPAGCAATLTFWLHIDSAETTTSVQYDKLTVKAGSTTLATYSNLNKASGYSQKSFNLSSFAGQTVTISFTGTEDSSLQTSFVVDDTALTAG